MISSHLIVVAIDGGAASGKSSTSRALAEKFNFLHVDTGSFYRAVTAELLHRGVRSAEPAAVSDELTDLHFNTRVEGRRAQMEIGGRVVPEAEIRSADVTGHVSHFAAIPAVRTALLTYQRGQADVARAHGFKGLVMEGRDIGSVIFPDADFRFFLHADPEERARRRAREGLHDVIAERDRLDASRTTAPLTCPPGAIEIDSTHLSLEEVVARVAALIQPRIGLR